MIEKTKKYAKLTLLLSVLRHHPVRPYSVALFCVKYLSTASLRQYYTVTKVGITSSIDTKLAQPKLKYRVVGNFHHIPESNTWICDVSVSRYKKVTYHKLTPLPSYPDKSSELMWREGLRIGRQRTLYLTAMGQKVYLIPVSDSKIPSPKELRTLFAMLTSSPVFNDCR